MLKKARPVIIFGGSFDPPHEGHIKMAAAALRRLRPAAFYFVPGWRTPFKDARPVPFAARREMLAAALREAGLGARPEVKISSFEASRRRVVYTVETLEHFRRKHPGAPLYFLLGSDCLAGFRLWRRWRDILKTATLLCGARPGHALKAPAGVPFTPLPGRFPQAASSALRAPLFTGERPRGVPAASIKVIENKGLYLGRERRLLARLLSPRRYEHSLAVARLAAALAPGLGLPEQAAALAGLLHDCARELPPAAALKFARAYARGKSGRGARLAETARRSPVLLHAWGGAGLAAARFGVKDPGLLAAIALHATGAPGMSLLARLIYVCDLAADGRDFREAELVRDLAPLDFKAAFAAANYVKLSYAFSRGGWVHPLAVSLWNSLLEKN